MSDISIRVDKISKWYRIEHDSKRPRYQTLRDQLSKVFMSPARRLVSQVAPEKAKNGSKPHDYHVWALKDVSFEVHQGELVGLIGPNGAGKSTLLKILTRITTPTEGTIDIYGRVGSLLEVGTGFHKELTGRDNVYLNGAILGMRKSEIDKKFDEIVAFSEVEKFIDTPVKFYSSGMTVRLAFAVAAHLDPEILLVDEVLAVGDAAFQKKCLSKMESVGQSGRTIIFVSHHMPSITRLCERALLLDHGRLILSGPADQVVGEYLSSNLGTSAYKEWMDERVAPGSEIAKLRTVRIIDENHNTNYTFDIRKPIGIEITFDVLKSGYALYPHISVHSEEEVHIFTSIDTDPEWRGVPRPPGRYVSVAWIPGNLLTEGVMTVDTGLRTEMPHLIHFHEKSVVAFHVVESPDGDTARMDYAGKLRGAVRPLLRWSNHYDPTPASHPQGGNFYGSR
ncbi:MAG: ATP-binding cassette domain-containing protein [Chloroflexi bacterium]|nr:ATP-binding cassette domain-containing protein [Chloroflexota bacterium]